MWRRPRASVSLNLLREGTAHLLAVVDEFTDEELREPSSLPGWSRAHVVGHVARNAEALGRLLSWARTGVETPMYAGPDERAREIEQSAGYPAAVLRSDLSETAAALDAAVGSLTAAQWQVQVRSALGRAIPAAEVPWMRIREVWLHAVDLGADVEDLPAGVVDLLLDDVVTVLSTKDGCPSAVLAPADRQHAWSLGAAGATTTVAAPAADLAGWLTGRRAHPDRPVLPRWL